ncbi:MAG: T9SS type A sorting domain-containing protein [Bacteroidia bacterium]|nr:T9SS type A sorting domain-containing protein [Bacteroidia bacterium]
MRKLSALMVALVATMSMYGQSAQPINRKAMSETEMRVFDRTTQFDLSATLPANTGTTGIPLGTTVTDAVTATKIGESSNAFTFLLPDNNQIGVVPDVGLNGGSVAFIYRQNINQCGGTGGDNGRYRYSISTDGGQTWNLGAASSSGGCYGLGPINPLYSQASRYPNMGLFLPPGANPDTLNLAMTYVGPVLTAAGSGWDGNVIGTVTDITTTPVTTQEAYPFQAGNQYFSYSLTERVPGEFWYASFTWDGTNIGNDVILNKGVWDNATESLNWTTVTTLSPNYYLGFDGTPTRAGSMNLAFSPDGMTGYVGLIADLVGGADSVMSPCMAATTDGGATWGNFVQFDMAEYYNRGLLDTTTQYFIDIDTITGDTVPVSHRVTAGFDFDLTVDKNGTPHFVAIVGSASLSNSDGTYDFPGYSIFSGLGLFVFDFTKDSYGDWNMLYVSKQVAFRGTFGDPANPTGSELVTADPWMQIARSADGRVIFYSWTDTDSTGNSANFTTNNRPDQITAAYNVDDNTITDAVSRTGDDANWASRAIMPRVAPIALYDKISKYTLPTVIMDMGPPGTAATLPVSFWYFSDVDFDKNTDFTNTGQFFYNCKENPIVGNLTVVSPDCGVSDGSLAVSATGGIGAYTYEWSANAGGVTTPNASGLAADIYSVVITDEVGCTSEVSVVLNNANAPTLSISASANITCNGANDGTATVTPTGGAGSETYLWDNGETTATATALAAGTHTCTVTDANGCKSFITVNITEPAAINVTAAATGVDCNGDTNGTAVASANGGTGTLSYLWSSGQTTPSVSGLAGGSYTVTVTDANNCAVTSNVTVAEPAPITTALFANANSAAVPVYTGNITATPSGGTAPYTLAWTGPKGFSDNTNTLFIFGLCGGTYYVQITDSKGCVFVDSAVVGTVGNGVNCVVDTATDAIDHELAAGINSMSLFPNPNNGSFTLSLELQNRDHINVQVIDLNGKIIATKNTENVLFVEEDFHIAGIASGIYLVKVTTSRGYATQKLIIR